MTGLERIVFWWEYLFEFFVKELKTPLKINLFGGIRNKERQEICPPVSLSRECRYGS
jgi:hypothetical protein